MIVFACPNSACQKRYKVTDDRAGKATTCANPTCGLRIKVPYPHSKPDPHPGELIDEETGAVLKDWRDEQPRERPRRRKRELEPEDDEPYPTRRRRRRDRLGRAVSPAVPTLIGAVLGTAVMVPPAVFLSQYWPVFGGILEKALAEPWSPARISLIPIHVFAFGFVGVVLGGAAGLLHAFSRRNVG